MAASVDGLVSGLDTTTIISQLMALERAPQDRLKASKTTASSTLTIYQTLNTRLSALQTAAAGLSRLSGWQLMKATSSDASAVAVSAGPGAAAGGFDFSVTQLARGGAVASSTTVASTGAVVASGNFLVSKGADQVGFASLASTGGLTLGAHSVEVTIATGGATVTGTAPLTAPATLASDLTLDVEVDGVAEQYTIRAGTYATPEALAAEVERASGGDLTASLSGTGALALTTTHEGSAASFRVTGGTAAATLNLATGGAAATGTDGAVKVDGGAAVVVSSARAGASATFTGPNGDIDVTYAGGLRVGTAAATNVSTGNGTLAGLVDAVNRAGAGVTAAAVKVGTGAYRLQLSSTTTGAGANVTASATGLTGLGSFSTVQAGRDAVVRVGEGDGAYEVTASSNTMSDILPGVTLNLLKADPGATVSVNVAADSSGLASGVQKMVDAANAALTYIKSQSSYDAETRKAGPLLSDASTRALQQQVLSAVSNIVTASSLGSAGFAGLSTAKDGTLTFDAAKFTAAYAADPAAVEALFRQGGTGTDASVSFASATAKTQAGTYAVAITQAATRAEKAGADLGGAGLTAGETIDLRVGGATGTTVSYSATAGESLSSVAAGLNAALGAKALGFYAAVENNALVVRSVAYGSLASFEVRSDTVAAGQSGLAAVAGAWEAHTGVNVAGTINGVAATGAGQILTAPPTDATLGGLALEVRATVPGALGTFSYVPGVAARLSSVASAAIDFSTGSVTSAINSKQNLIRDLDTRISSWDNRLSLRETSLRRQYAALETALGQLRSQSSWLSGQIASLPSAGG